MGNKDRKGDINFSVTAGGQADRVCSTLVCHDTRHQAFRLQFLPKEPEHFRLQIYRNHPARISGPLCKLTGEAPGTAAEIKDDITGYYIVPCKVIGAINKSSQAGIKEPGAGCREHLMRVRMLMFPRGCGRFPGIYDGHGERLEHKGIILLPGKKIHVRS